MEIVETKVRRNLFLGYMENEEYADPEVIVHSWENCYSDCVAKNSEEEGLRQPQFGALCAIRSYWTVNARPATIVMPTGERVIIVMGAIYVIKSRVSETLTKYNSCIA